MSRAKFFMPAAVCQALSPIFKLRTVLWRQTNPICFYFSDEEIRPSNIKVSHIGELGEPASHGYSSFKFIPGTQDKVIIALKSEELEGKIATYVMVFNIDGTILFPETKIGDLKFEGIEFV